MKSQTFLRYGLPLLATGMLVFAVFASTSRPERPPNEPPVAPAVSPFDRSVAGLGIVEPNSELIAIGAHLPGVVTRVGVQVGDKVARGDPLFSVDDRDARARLAAAQSQLAAARVKQADSAQQLALYRNVTDRRAISQDELDRRAFAEKVAASQVKVAEAEVALIRTELERLVVRAPVDGTVLKVNVRPGEFAAAGIVKDPLMTMGNVEPLHVRAELDETDAWAAAPDARAFARVRGRADLSASLRFVRREPLLKPKRTLTGDGNERVDTRVLEVIYALDNGALNAFVGQQVDVFVERAATVDVKRDTGGRTES
jgi:multidrug efflux pump subunit AcrA (membrane-fusion protein)